MDVSSGTGVAVGAGVGVDVGTGVAVAVGTGVGVDVSSGTGVAVGAGVGVDVGSGVAVGVNVGMSVASGTGVAVGTGEVPVVASGASAVPGTEVGEGSSEHPIKSIISTTGTVTSRPMINFDTSVLPMCRTKVHVRFASSLSSHTVQKNLAFVDRPLRLLARLKLSPERRSLVVSLHITVSGP